MNINFITTVKKIEKDHTEAIKEYLKRLSRFSSASLKYVKSGQGDEKKDTWNILIVPGIASPSSVELASKIKSLTNSGYSTINFIIADSTDESNYVFNEVMSVSSFTMSYGLTTTVATEQVYRAFCILNNITYHK